MPRRRRTGYSWLVNAHESAFRGTSPGLVRSHRGFREIVSLTRQGVVIAVVPRVDPVSFPPVPIPKNDPPPGYSEFYGWHNGIFYGLNITDRNNSPNTALRADGSTSTGASYRNIRLMAPITVTAATFPLTGTLTHIRQNLRTVLVSWPVDFRCPRAHCNQHLLPYAAFARERVKTSQRPSVFL